MKILVVEDEPAVSGFVEQALRESGYETVVARTGREALTAVEHHHPDLILLDALLPDLNGIDLLPDVRDLTMSPIIMVTALGSLEDRVRGLDAGADDYLPKPFRVEELLARVRALLRRPRAEPLFHLGSLEIDFQSRRVIVAGRLVFLSTTEYLLLALLARNSGKPVSKQDILREVWDDTDRDSNVVEVYVNYLRHKLERGGVPRLVHTVRGKGYTLEIVPRLAQ